MAQPYLLLILMHFAVMLVHTVPALLVMQSYGAADELDWWSTAI